ncbi:hypothetical protein F5Y06DRAFT_235922 [Hypoxylon sp. FL0890]|nr:hypothetical protein F5Y06DRAFT_235922 [Hypoxylon sp. FL0890]
MVRITTLSLFLTLVSPRLVGLSLYPLSLAGFESQIMTKWTDFRFLAPRESSPTFYIDTVLYQDYLYIRLIGASSLRRQPESYDVGPFHRITVSACPRLQENPALSSFKHRQIPKAPSLGPELNNPHCPTLQHITVCTI